MTASEPPPAPPAQHDAYVALRHRNFRWYILSLFTMTLGSQLQAVVVGWQVYTITRDPLSLGLIGLAEALPFIAVALPAGYVADRWNRRTVAVLALAVLALCSVALLVLSAADGMLARVGVTPIYAVIFASGIARSLLQPARQALSSELVPRHQLENAIAWRSSSWQTAAVAGPALGGLLYGFAGPVVSYSVDAALMLFALVAMLIMRYTPGVRTIGRSPIVPDLLQGLKFVWGQPLIRRALTRSLFGVSRWSDRVASNFCIGDPEGWSAGVGHPSCGTGGRGCRDGSLPGASSSHREGWARSARVGCGVRDGNHRLRTLDEFPVVARASGCERHGGQRERRHSLDAAPIAYSV